VRFAASRLGTGLAEHRKDIVDAAGVASFLLAALATPPAIEWYGQKLDTSGDSTSTVGASETEASAATEPRPNRPATSDSANQRVARSAAFFTAHAGVVQLFEPASANTRDVFSFDPHETCVVALVPAPLGLAVAIVLAFGEPKHWKGYRVALVNLEGRNPVVVWTYLDDTFRRDTVPEPRVAWSADGARVAILTDKDEFYSDKPRDLYVIERNGRVIGHTRAELADVRWANRRLLVLEGHSWHWGVGVLLDVDRGVKTRIGQMVHPRVSPNGRFLAYLPIQSLRHSRYHGLYPAIEPFGWEPNPNEDSCTRRLMNSSCARSTSRIWSNRHHRP
jgi:hypothetical protein